MTDGSLGAWRARDVTRGRPESDKEDQLSENLGASKKTCKGGSGGQECPRVPESEGSWRERAGCMK